MFLPENIQFLLNLDTILASKLILEQALPAFATAWLHHWFKSRVLSCSLQVFDGLRTQPTKLVQAVVKVRDCLKTSLSAELVATAM